MADMLRAALRGDRQALEALCAHYHPILCRFFRGLLRGGSGDQDLAQETLVALLEALPSYTPMPGKRFEGYVLRIGYNKFIDMKRRRTESALPPGYDPPDPAGDPAQWLLRDERARQVRRAVNGLDEDLRAMVLMRYALEMDYRAIAQALGTTPNRVKWRLHDALEKLKVELHEEGLP